jgi:hypothetical protein
MRAKLFIASCALAATVWAVPSVGAAHLFARRDASSSNTMVAPPLPARFRLEKDLGLMLRVWINGGGPYFFAVDTGAGLNVISQRAAGAARLPIRNTQHTIIGGLSSARTSSSRETVINQMALGERGNTLPSTQTALIVSNLPPDLDGILDPTQAYSPYGYAIDLPNERIEALTSGIINLQPRLRSESAIVSWLRVEEDGRPFVKLGDGRVALVDTGSGFGLGVSDRNAIIIGRNGQQRQRDDVRDIAGGSVAWRRVSPTTITIGELMLRRIPTDILFGVEKGAPVILGRDALYPFKISFDPQKRLIQFVATAEIN